MANLNIPFLLTPQNEGKTHKVFMHANSKNNKEFSSSKINQQTYTVVRQVDNNMLISEYKVMQAHQSNEALKRFTANLQDKICCMLSLEEQNSLLDSCEVQSPAEHIISTSEFLLLTLFRSSNNQSCLFLWNQNDGRCIMRSEKSLFSDMTPLKLVSLNSYFSGKAYKGIVLVVCEGCKILVLNAYTMRITDYIQLDISKVIRVKVNKLNAELTIELLSEEGSIHIVGLTKLQVSDSISKSQKSRVLLDQLDGSSQSKLSSLLEVQHRVIAARIGTDSELSRDSRGPHKLLLDWKTANELLIIEQDRLSLLKQGQQRQTDLLQFENNYDTANKYALGKKLSKQQMTKINWFIFGTIINSHQQVALAIDNKLNLYIHNFQKLAQELNDPIQRQNDKPEVFFQNLITQSCIQQQFSPKSEYLGKDDADYEKQEFLSDLQQKLQCSQDLIFNYLAESSVLFAFTSIRESKLCKGKTIMLSWCLKDLLQGRSNKIYLNYDTISVKSPFIKPQNSACSINKLIKINSFVESNYFSEHQHSFFYSDETITERTFYVSADYPAQIIGTSRGRIFISQMFQDIEGRAFPVLVIDCHGDSAITKLYMAYSPSRRSKQNNLHQDGDGSHLAQMLSLDSGGHLIATSANGTLSITNMNSRIVIDQLQNFNIRRNNRDKIRAKAFMKEREANVRSGRRNSFQNHCSFGKFFNLVRVHPLKTFPRAYFGSVKDIVQVAVLQQQETDRQYYFNQMITEPQQIDSSPTNQREYDELSSQALASDFQWHVNMVRQSISEGQPLIADTHQKLIEEQMPLQVLYAIILEKTPAVMLIQINSPGQVDIKRLSGFDSQPIGVYEDHLQNIVHVVCKSLNTFSYFKKTGRFSRKSGYQFTISFLQIKQTIQCLTQNQQYFKMALSNQAVNNGDCPDICSFGQQYSNKLPKQGSQEAAQHHSVLDYLSKSLSLPLYFHPHHLLSQKYTKTSKDLLVNAVEMNNYCKSTSENNGSVQNKALVEKIIEQDFVWNSRYCSDFNIDYYQAQGAVTALSGKQNQLLIANTKDMINIFKSRMSVLTDSIKVNPKASIASGSSNIPAEYFQSSKWPTRLLSLVHPFVMDSNLDENLELFFGLSIPFLDAKIGVQGIDETFSFVIQSDQQELPQKELIDDLPRLNQAQLINLNRYIAIQKKMTRYKSQVQHETYQNFEIEQVPKRFVNHCFWRTSPYLSTIMTAFFTSTLVSIVEFAQQDIRTLLQDWLNLIEYLVSDSDYLNQFRHKAESGHDQAAIILQQLQHARQQISQSIQPISISVVSQLLLRRDPILSSCSRDIILKPILSSNQQAWAVKNEIDQWQDLIMNTYSKLKEDSNMKQTYENGEKKEESQNNFDNYVSKQIRQASPQQAVADNQTGKQQTLQINSLQQNQPVQERQQINNFFGELEIRGLINLSYYALFTLESTPYFKISQDVQNRLCKCTVILTREIMTKFTLNTKEYQHLLTVLMQLLQTQMRAKIETFKTKNIKEDVIKILLLIYDFHKKQLKDEHFLTRVFSEKFHLIYPKNQELFLKLTAAKSLLEIGTNYTDDFLKVIDEHATTLKDGPEYQYNVLDVLRYFISSNSRDKLDKHLIQIVSTLLKCLDFNDEQLRRNSTGLISRILSQMVKGFQMVAFHHEQQRLAVGTLNGLIVIYDIRTSSKWKVLEGHKSRVAVVEFDSRGNILVSYCPQECSLRIWKLVPTGIFGSFLGGGNRAFKEVILKPAEVQLQLPSQDSFKERPIQRRFSRGAQSSRASEQPVKHTCKLRLLDNDKLIELTREDGSVVEHRISR